MQFTSALLSTLSLVGLSAASPVQANEPRAVCLEKPPSYIGFPTKYHISQSTTPVVSFNVPPNSVGPCALVAKFPAGYPVGNSGYSLVNVRANSGPVAGSIVGTLRFQSSPTAPTFVTVNSFACATTMSYQLEIADSTQAGDVYFSQTKHAGLFMDVGDAC